MLISQRRCLGECLETNCGGIGCRGGSRDRLEGFAVRPATWRRRYWRRSARLDGLRRQELP